MSLFPYLELMKEDLLDGIMVGHCKLPKIDPDYPATLSKKIIDIIREQGYDGLTISDGLSMMGIVAKFGETDSKGLAVENGIDNPLVWCSDNKVGYDALYECYKKGIISEARLNEAVKRVLATQHKVFTMQPKYTEITQDDAEAIEKINKDSIYAKTDEGVAASVSREGRHLFMVLTDMEAEISEGQLSINTFAVYWYNPGLIMERLGELFPHSEAIAIREFPTKKEIIFALHKACQFDDVVFITYKAASAYVGREEFTPRIISLIEAMQVSEQVSTIVHLGNPYALEPLPHVPRIIIGTCSSQAVMTSLDVLAGNYPAKGELTYPVKL